MHSPGRMSSEGVRIRFYNSLRWRLSLLFVLVIAASGLVQLYFSTRGWRELVEHIEQQVNWDLASDIAERIQPELIGAKTTEQIERTLFSLTVLNPKTEFVLLDEKGVVVAAIPFRDRVARRVVELAPLRRALEPAIPSLPLYADDPFGGPGSRKIFSVAPIQLNGQQGYLYVPLMSSTYDFLVRHTGQLYLVRIISVGLAISWVFALGAGFLLYTLLTRRFRGLAKAIERLRDGEANVVAPIGREDEVGMVASAFNGMANTISENTEELRRKDRLRRELIANISHDLRGPVTAILAHVEALRERDSESETRQRYLEVIEESAQAQRTLVEDLFLLATLEAREERSDKDYCSLARIVVSVVSALGPAAQKREVTVTTELPAELPLIYADSGMIHRVLFNLISNAIRFSKPNGNVRISAIGIDGAVRVKVADEGIGIRGAELPFIFDSFYRANTHRPEDPGGTGLGLAIVKKLLELHSSVPKVESEEDRGTTISFDLPTDSEVSARE